MKEIAQYWAESPVFDAKTRQEIQRLLEPYDEKEIADRFAHPLEFGTGGMRGLMGAGLNRMNEYTVRQATEGLARYIEKHPDPSHQKVVIGHDSRHRSEEFAQAASEVLAAHGIGVYLFKDLAPTPLVSFEVLQQKAIAGIVITASHNPKEYNGYKVYWKNGGQVTPPEDQGIIEEVRQVTRFEEIPQCPFEEALRQGKVQWLTAESDQRYLKVVEEMALGKKADNAALRVIYTPLHGTGVRLVPSLLKNRGFQQLSQIEAQSTADGDFPTVQSPNPEDPKVFEMAVAAATPEDDLIVTNDPDADRLGVMVQHGGQWHQLTGNQIGALLLDDRLNRLQQENRLPSDGVVVSSIVSSPLIAKMARSRGLGVIETLTGFKWIRAAALRVEEEGGTFVFGMEESLGYLAGSHTGDKDGVWAAMAFAELTASLKTKNQTPIDRLQAIYHEQGYHLDDLENRTLPGLDGQEQIQKIMQNFRKNPPPQFGGKLLVRMIDLQDNTATHINDGQKTAGLNLPKSNVLIFELEQDTRVIMRPSGTEPKIKYYFNLAGENETALKASLAQVKQDVLQSAEPLKP